MSEASKDELISNALEMENEIRNKADWCHNNIGSKTWEDWEDMDRFLIRTADVIRSLTELSRQ